MSTNNTDCTNLVITINVSIVAFFLLILTIFGSLRRRFLSAWIRFPVWLAYVASEITITTTIGQLLRYDVDCLDTNFAFWTVFLLLALSSSDTISALDLDECYSRLRRLGQSSLQAFWGIWIVLYVLIREKVQPSYWVPITCFWLLAVVKALERAAVLMCSSRPFGLAKTNKLTADFMSYNQQQASHPDTAQKMEEYNYLVRVPLTSKIVEVHPPDYRKDLKITSNVVTVQKVWECNGRLLGDDPQGQRRKDICLSYALFKIIRCRFAGYSMREYLSDMKTWKLVRDKLLSEESGHERVFRVIETELSFLYDFFYTKYPVVTKPQYLLFIRLPEVGVLFASYWAAATDSSSKINKKFTLTVISTIILIEAVQLFYIIFSDWTKINCLTAYVRCQCLQKNPCVGMIISFLCHPKWKPWGRKLGQYSLLESFHSKLFIARVAKPFALIMDVPRKGQKESKRVPLIPEVKTAIVEALKAIVQDRPSQLTNGTASLGTHGVAEELKWACEHKSPTHVILVWHIATSLYEMHFIETLEKKNAKSLLKDENYQVATKLSKYCAYLVAFQPRLLPDHSYDTQFIFDQVVQDARNKLRGFTGCNCLIKNKMYEQMMNLGDGDSILNMGAKLGKNLIGQRNQSRIWKVLADFWVELVLYLAPSNDLMAHAERLAFAGEFITHLWALLFHAGIISRDSATLSHDSV